MFILSVAHLYSFSYLPFVKNVPYSCDPITSHHLRMRLLGENLSGAAEENLLTMGNSSCNDIELSMDSAAVSEETTGTSTSSSFTSKQVQKLLSSHFAADSAIRDFNDSMPIIHIPTNFEVRKGSVILSNPASRLKEMNQHVDGNAFV